MGKLGRIPLLDLFGLGTEEIMRSVRELGDRFCEIINGARGACGVAIDGPGFQPGARRRAP